MKEQEAIGTIEREEFFLKYNNLYLFLLLGWLKSCPERLWRLSPWSYSKAYLYTVLGSQLCLTLLCAGGLDG